MEANDKSKANLEMASIMISNLEELLRDEKHQKVREAYQKRILELKQQWFNTKAKSDG